MTTASAKNSSDIHAEVDMHPEVLTVAPNKRWKGGISSVIMAYEKSIRGFRHFPSTTSENIYLTFISFPWLVIRYVFTLAFDQKINIVHIHGASQGSFYRKYIFFWLAKYIFQKRVVYHMHGGGFHLFYKRSSSFIQKRIQHFINQADCLVVLSPSWEAYFAQHFQPQRIRIIPNIVAENKTIGIPTPISDTIHFLFLGKIGKNKGIYDLIEVLHEHREELLGKCLLTIGGNGEVEKLQALIEQYDLHSLISYVGFVTGEAKEKLLAQSHVYILPSYNEGLPISILEAMSYQMPIIATAVGGIPEVVQHHENGLLIEPGNKQELASAVRFFLSNPEKIETYGSQSYEIVSQRHFPTPVMSALNSMYAEILSS